MPDAIAAAAAATAAAAAAAAMLAAMTLAHPHREVSHRLPDCVPPARQLHLPIHLAIHIPKQHRSLEVEHFLRRKDAVVGGAEALPQSALEPLGRQAEQRDVGAVVQPKRELWGARGESPHPQERGGRKRRDE